MIKESIKNIFKDAEPVKEKPVFLEETKEDKRPKNRRNIFNSKKIDPIFIILVAIFGLAGCFFFISILAGELALLIAGWIIAYIICVFESKIKVTDLFIHINKHKSLFFFTVLMSALIMYESGIIGGLLLLILAWGYNDKKDAKLINRLRNFKQHKIRFMLSAVIVLVSVIMIFLHFTEAKRQAFVKNYPESAITIISNQDKQENTKYELRFSVENYTNVKVNGEQVNSENHLFSKTIDLKTLQTKIVVDAKNEYKSAQKTILINRNETDEEKRQRTEREKDRKEQEEKIRAEAKARGEKRYQDLADIFCSSRSERYSRYINLDDFSDMLESGQVTTIHNVIDRAPSKASCRRIAEQCLKHWTDEECKKMAEQKIWLGMTENQLILSWGLPKDKNNTVGVWGVSSQWVYGDFGPYVYLEGSNKEDLIVTSW